MKKADELLIQCLREPDVSLKDELCTILDRYNDNKGHQTHRSNSLRMERELNSLIERNI